MRIESIEIQNFRQFRNLSFKFPHSYGENDLHIIFANNGVGKTNVLNAITWCLYFTTRKCIWEIKIRHLPY